MLDSSTDEDICSHLYMAEPYYFNPKQIKRQQVSVTYKIKHIDLQVLKLIKRLKDGYLLNKQIRES